MQIQEMYSNLEWQNNCPRFVNLFYRGIVSCWQCLPSFARSGVYFVLEVFILAALRVYVYRVQYFIRNFFRMVANSCRIEVMLGSL